jgi:hypothetical protein
VGLLHLLAESFFVESVKMFTPKVEDILHSVKAFYDGVEELD